MSERFRHSFAALKVDDEPLPLQPRLTVGLPGDEYEREAEAVADQVMRVPAGGWAPVHGRKADIRHVMRAPAGEGMPSVDEDDPRLAEVLRLICPDCENETVQTRPMGVAGPEMNTGLEGRIQRLRGGGVALDPITRSFFEERFGRDFGAVRVHTDASAAQTAVDLRAMAYTLGGDIVFAPGQYAPRTSMGQRLLAHELTHVVQQGGAGPAAGAQRQLGPAPAAARNPLEVRMQASRERILRHTVADCDLQYERCGDRCRALPKNARRRRALCWAACAAEYATCLATAQETLTVAAIIAAIVLATADGPFPIGDAAAALLLLSLGIIR